MVLIPIFLICSAKKSCFEQKHLLNEWNVNVKMLSGAAESRRDFNVLCFSKEKQDQLIKSHMLFNITETDGLCLYLASCLIFCDWWEQLFTSTCGSETGNKTQRLSSSFRDSTRSDDKDQKHTDTVVLLKKEILKVIFIYLQFGLKSCQLLHLMIFTISMFLLLFVFISFQSPCVYSMSI